MNCHEMEQYWIAYLDGKADSSVRRRVETHLAACPACWARAQEFRSVWGALDELPVISPSPAFDAAVRQCVAAEPRRASLWAWLVPAPRLAFAVTVLVILSAWLTSQQPARQAAVPAMPQSSEAEFRMIRDLPVLEDYDVLQSFDVLSELPVQQPASQTDSER